MEVYAFRALCNRLRRDVALHDSTREVTVEEALGMFCYTVGHGVVQRNSANLFQHSVETVNRHVYAIMRALCRLACHVIKPNQTTGVMPYIEGNPRYYPWFERLAQNVLCVCDFNMKFTFVYAGWEGTAHDARIFIDALRRPENNFPWPQDDSTFPCTEGYMPLYPRVRYHRSERHGNRTFQGYKDLFNYRHSSIQNVIERTFGVLKRRFRLLKNMPEYRPTRQRYIIIACCAIHNFIRIVTPNDQTFLAFNNPDDYLEMSMDQDSNEQFHVPDMSTASAQSVAASRDAIAQAMWMHTVGQQGNT
ncbi:uncharacterized protein LOC122305681 [Carya illinoinensis]|uniref:uncharacterized protein LOC122305681 n=1 Tax=Carya illinoinensis TaxID=32201 RepID=UPI001C719B42|nr:uncharacterized protein LOC122305681 [Carya illinoinensis]